LQNENPNLTKDETNKPAAMQVAIQIDKRDGSDERASWIELGEEDPERWDGLS
jgi:hypothetical protein